MNNIIPTENNQLYSNFMECLLYDINSNINLINNIMIIGSAANVYIQNYYGIDGNYKYYDFTNNNIQNTLDIDIIVETLHRNDLYEILKRYGNLNVKSVACNYISHLKHYQVLHQIDLQFNSEEKPMKSITKEKIMFKTDKVYKISIDMIIIENELKSYIQHLFILNKSRRIGLFPNRKVVKIGYDIKPIINTQNGIGLLLLIQIVKSIRYLNNNVIPNATKSGIPITSHKILDKNIKSRNKLSDYSNEELSYILKGNTGSFNVKIGIKHMKYTFPINKYLYKKRFGTPVKDGCFSEDLCPICMEKIAIPGVNFTIFKCCNQAVHLHCFAKLLEKRLYFILNQGNNIKFGRRQEVEVFKGECPLCKKEYFPINISDDKLIWDRTTMIPEMNNIRSFLVPFKFLKEQTMIYIK